MFDTHKVRLAPFFTPTHSRTNSVNSVKPHYFRTRQLQPEKSYSRLSYQSKDQISQHIHPHEFRSIDLYLPNCQLDPKQYASILSLISIRNQSVIEKVGL